MCQARKDVEKIGEEWLSKILKRLSFKNPDVEVYLSLTKNSNQTAGEIAKALKMNSRQVYRSLKTMQAKGIASMNAGHPANFSVLSFEQVLEAFIIENVEEAELIEKNKKEILAKWQSLIEGTV